MRKDMEKIQEELKERYVQAAAGGDLVEVMVNGQQEVVKVTIDPKFFGEAGGKVDVELLEDLIVAAVSQGIEKSKTLMKEELEKVTGGLGGMLPGLI
jgi:DNA-binding YbaB/EbfC family protein